MICRLCNFCMVLSMLGVLFHIQHLCANMRVFSPCSSGNDILVGNLSRDAVEEIMDSMLKNGYADISGYSYQKEHQCIYSIVFDNGKSDPYYLLDFAAIVGLDLGALALICLHQIHLKCLVIQRVTKIIQSLTL